MIKHIVMWTLKDGPAGATRADNALQVQAWLEACRDAVPGMLRFEAVVAQAGMEASCDVVLYSEFASRAALDAYHAHPLHQQLKTLVGPLRAARHGIDYEV